MRFRHSASLGRNDRCRYLSQAWFAELTGYPDRIDDKMFVVHDLSCLKVANFSVCADKMRFPASVQAGQRGKAGSAGEMRAAAIYAAEGHQQYSPGQTSCPPQRVIPAGAKRSAGVSLFQAHIQKSRFQYPAIAFSNCCPCSCGIMYLINLCMVKSGYPFNSAWLHLFSQSVKARHVPPAEPSFRFPRRGRPAPPDSGTCPKR